jgi:hypothetical protein
MSFEFDSERLMKLSGLETEGGNGVLSEGKVVETPAPLEEDINEVTLRKIVRSEVESIVRELRDSGGAGSKWIYGLNKPKRSAPGRVTLGMLGVGFGVSK